MSELVPKDPERIPDQGEPIEIGQWYWLKLKNDRNFFGCVVQIGSNFVEFENVYESDERVHLNEFWKFCRRELDPGKVIGERIAFFRGVVNQKLGQIKEITARLGLVAQEKQPTGDSRALSVLSEQPDMKKYKKDLIEAKEKQLPELFKEVEDAHASIARWMKAEAIPMSAMASNMKGVIEVIEGRVFNVSLYAGLTEEVTQFAKGKPAPSAERLRVLQRMLYMDEECLVNYRHGGMEFKHIGKFDKWLAEPVNRDRVLPFARSIVAFRVRRERKERDWGGSLKQIFVNIDLEALDKLTFLYIRNGENLYRLNCDLEFDDLIFPGKNEMDLSEPMMAKMWGASVEGLITKRDFDAQLAHHKEEVRKYHEWERANPKKSWVENPHASDGWAGDSKFDRYQPFDPSSVYYDEIKKTIEKRIQYFNRVAIIIQGLFDRSEILHPHSPVRLWSPEGFEAAVELIYDGSNMLTYGEAPNFEAYRERCNQSLGKGSITCGQDDYWAEKEAYRECERMRNDWRTKSEYRPSRFRPYGNPGPGYLAEVFAWSQRKKRATFRWIRERRVATWEHRYGEPINAALVAPASRLFNVSAYKPGDYKQFFVDPRTRMNYLQWAPLLIAAEEYHAGNLKLKDAVAED